MSHLHAIGVVQHPHLPNRERLSNLAQSPRTPFFRKRKHAPTKEPKGEIDGSINKSCTQKQGNVVIRLSKTVLVVEKKVATIDTFLELSFQVVTRSVFCNELKDRRVLQQLRQMEMYQFRH